MTCKTLLFLCLLLPARLWAQDSIDNSRLLDMYQSGKFAEAASYIKSRHSDSLQSESILKSLSYAYQMAGNLVEAEKAYLKLYEKDSTSLPTLISLGSIHAKRRNNEEALHFYRKALDLDSNNIMIYQRLSEIEFSRNRTLDAHNYLLKASVINPANADVAYNLAMLSISLGNIQQADSIILTALDFDEENRHLLFGKAVVKEKLKQYDEAIETCSMLLELGSDSLDVLPILGPLHFYKKEYKDCLAVMSWLEETLFDLSEGSLFIMGVSHAWTGNPELGLEYLDKAIESGISPSMSRYYAEKGKIYQTFKNYPAAVTSYKRGLDYKEDPLSLYNIALIYDYYLNKSSESIPYYKKFVETSAANANQEISEFVKGRLTDLEGQ